MERRPDMPPAADLALLERISRSVARRRRLSAQDEQDFAQAVQLRVIERDYDVFRQFAGRSSLETYLHVVVTRLLLDWLNGTYGKWRACAAARSLGETAIALDRTLNRDGYTLDQAIALLARPAGPSDDELRKLAAQLPRRARRRFVSADEIDWAAAAAFEDPIEATLRRRQRHDSVRALRRAVRQLSRDEQELIALRYSEHRSVQDIAGRTGVDARVLYRRFERLLRSLRLTLAGDGITGSSSAA